ncbi:MAG: SRPBCC domain-containing protein [Candidatus Zixiibacteriota bacterium]
MSQPFGKDIKQTTFIAAPIEKVYATITSAKEWNAFFTTGMELDPVPNGKMIWRWKDWGPNFYSTEADARVIKAEHPHHFVFQWYPVDKDNPTTISFKLIEKFGGTVVELTESGYPDSDKGRAMILECASGWGEALTLLKFYIEHGIIYTPPKKEN